MKKFLSLVLAAVLLLGTAMPAFASEVPEETLPAAIERPVYLTPL